MGSKRPSESPDIGWALLMNASNGNTYNIEKDEEFVIGRSTTCSLTIRETYISRCHCVIRHSEQGKFFITNYNDGTGTFVNCEPLPKDKKSLFVLDHGDLISFSEDGQQMTHIFKFCVSSRQVKKPRLDDERTTNTIKTKILNGHEQNDDHNRIQTLHKLRADILSVKVDSLIIANQARNQSIEFQTMMNEALKSTEQRGTEINQQKAVIEELVKKVSKHEDMLRVFQERRFDMAIEQQESSIELFKNQVHDLLENECQCPICSEIIVSAHTTNCNHTFCDSCITRWLSDHQYCPVCRSLVITSNYCIVMDSFITSLCDLLGGSVKLQRENLMRDREIQRIQAVQRAARNVRRNRRRRRDEDERSSMNDESSPPFLPHIIDLTE